MHILTLLLIRSVRMQNLTFEATAKEFAGREFSGSLLQQLNDAYDFIDIRNQTRATFEKLRRIDERDYPEVAVREALLNSLVHLDYSFGASTFISIYKDRIEFITIGGLPAGVSLDDIVLGLSVCRNSKLANIFYRLELIEAYGTGMRKIIKSYENSGKVPVIKTTGNAFKIILPNRNEGIEKPDAENELEEKVLESVKKHGVIVRKDVEEVLDLGQTAAGRMLKKMSEKGLLVQKGQGKNTNYTLPV